MSRARKTATRRTSVGQRGKTSTHTPGLHAPPIQEVTIKPTMDLILLEVLPQITRTPGGILLPNGTKMDSYRKGIVVAVGPGKMLDHQSECRYTYDYPDKGSGDANTVIPIYRPVRYSIGQTVLFDYPAALELGKELTGNKEIVLAREEGILAVLEVPSPPENNGAPDA